MNIIVKRGIIISSLLLALFLLQLVTTDSLLLNIPTNNEALAFLNDLNETTKEIDNEIDAFNDLDQLAEFDRLFDDSIRHTFIIEFSQSGFDGLVNDMVEYYEKYETFKSNNYRRVDVTYISDGEEITIENVGFRSKGNIYSRRLPIDEDGNVREIHFMLKFNETFNYYEGTNSYETLKKREFCNLEQVLFKMNNQWDPTYSNEVFSYDMFREIGVVVPEASFAEVRIVVDGKTQLVSLYNIFEHYDEEFIRRTFNDEGVKEVGDLYKGQWSATLEPIYDSTLYGVRDWRYNYRPLYSKETNKDTNSYDTLVKFTYGLNEEDLSTRQTFLQDNFNIDSFLQTMAMNVLLGNPDDYRGNGNNFYYYFDQSGYMTYVPFDYDNSMGNGWDGKPAFIDYTLGNDIYEWGHFDWNSFDIPLWTNLMEYEEYRIQYENYLEEYILSDLYSEESYLEMYDTVRNLYGSEFDMRYDKGDFIYNKRKNVLEDIEYYRNKRN